MREQLEEIREKTLKRLGNFIVGFFGEIPTLNEISQQFPHAPGCTGSIPLELEIRERTVYFGGGGAWDVGGVATIRPKYLTCTECGVAKQVRIEE
ncbi:MAG: hypothetical protein Q7R79_03865 [bacterium]|nr:hypothetical protein [bacterium]